MISIIVSSNKEEYFSNFKNSLNNTIGVPYELIKIENPNKFSLSEAYNIGGEKARFEILLFVHEDVIFVSENWGQTLKKLFEENQKLGIVGVAGALKKSSLPTGWGTGTSKFDRINLIQVFDDQEKIHTTRKAKETAEEIKVLDGVFIATPKIVWEKFKFDKSVSGFHVYDIDFSLRVTQYYTGIISYEILLKHFSIGNYNSEWVKMTLEYHKRNDKFSLFDLGDSFASNIRRAWYKALTFGDISEEMRIEFAKQMGKDFLSLIHAFAFRYPGIGRNIFKLISFIGL